MGHAGRSGLALGWGHGRRHSASCCGALHVNMERCRCGGGPSGRRPCVTWRNEVRCVARWGVVVLLSGGGADPGGASPQGVSRRREALQACAASLGTARRATLVRRGAARDELVDLVTLSGAARGVMPSGTKTPARQSESRCGVLHGDVEHIGVRRGSLEPSHARFDARAQKKSTARSLVRLLCIAGWATGVLRVTATTHGASSRLSTLSSGPSADPPPHVSVRRDVGEWSIGRNPRNESSIDVPGVAVKHGTCPAE